jgi:pimeloyl-ACP methyl ester carboxylesterase
MAEDFDLTLSRGRLHVHRFGNTDDGQVPVFCIPGLSSNSRVFDAFGEYRQARGRGIIALDLRGRGWSDITPPGTYGWERHAQDVFEAADALGIERFDLAGHSMGAFVTMAATALDRSQRIRRVVLIDGLGIPTQTALTAIGAGVARLKNAFPSRDAYIDAVRAVGTASPWNDYWERHYRYDLIETPEGIRPRTDLRAVNEDAGYGMSHDVHAYWRRVVQPTLLLRATVPIGGTDGFIVTRKDYDTFLHAAPQARGIEIDANHFGIAVDPVSSEAIDAFLSAADSASH